MQTIKDHPSAIVEVRSNTHCVPVNYERSVEQAIEAGRYSTSHHLVNSPNFEYTEKEGMKLVLMEVLSFSSGNHRETLTTKEVVGEIKNRGSYHANVWELLAFGERKREELKKGVPLMGLGSLLLDDDFCLAAPCIIKDMKGRISLAILPYESEWTSDYEFATIPAH